MSVISVEAGPEAELSEVLGGLGRVREASPWETGRLQREAGSELCAKDWAGLGRWQYRVHSQEASFWLGAGVGGGQEIRGNKEQQPRQRAGRKGAAPILSPLILESAWRDRCCYIHRTLEEAESTEAKG